MRAGLVQGRGGRTVAERVLLIRPASRQFHFTHIHGLTWEDVESEPTFGEPWPTVREFIDGTDYLFAHNAAFDAGVLRDVRC